MIVYEEDFYKRLPHTLENINLFMVERAKEKEELTFEEKIKLLEEIVKELESGEVPLYYR